MAGLALYAPAAVADPVADFYKGKEIKMLIGPPIDGGYDTYARWFARRLPDFMQGNPSVTVQNMPGAGGVVQRICEIAPAARSHKAGAPA